MLFWGKINRVSNLLELGKLESWTAKVWLFKTVFCILQTREAYILNKILLASTTCIVLKGT